MPQINISCTLEEHATLKAIAAEAGLPISTYTKLIVLRGLQAAEIETRLERLERIAVESMRLTVSFGLVSGMNHTPEKAGAESREYVREWLAKDSGNSTGTEG